MQFNQNQPIGIYDSGIGGLTVLKTLLEKLPNERFVYFADTANLPYGNKTPEEITTFSHRIISWFQNTVKTKLVIAACHTSSAIALENVADHFDVPVIGTIHPMLEPLLTNSAHRKIGIIATPASANSLMHETIIKAQGFSGKITSIACPNFVPLIESLQHTSEHHEQDLDYHAELYLGKFIEEELDTLIFGCTHYPLIKAHIAKYLPEHVTYIDPADYIALSATKLLANTNLLRSSPEQIQPKTQLEFYCSKDPNVFTNKLQKILASNDIARLHSKF